MTFLCRNNKCFLQKVKCRFRTTFPNSVVFLQKRRINDLPFALKPKTFTSKVFFPLTMIM